VGSPPTFVVRYRETARGAPGIATVVWAIVMAVSIFGIAAHLSTSFFWVLAVTTTFLLAAYLGWMRSMGVIFFAPIVSWLFAWFPLIVGMMIHRGFFAGLFWGVLWSTIGWVGIGAAEFIALFVMALPFRIVTAMVHHDDTIIIERPWGNAS
jgi:hypothetical protein